MCKDVVDWIVEVAVEVEIEVDDGVRNALLRGMRSAAGVWSY